MRWQRFIVSNLGLEPVQKPKPSQPERERRIAGLKLGKEITIDPN